MRILAIAHNTFRENIRDKILYNLILFALVMILSSIALGQLTLGLESKMIIDLGLTSVSVFGTLIAIFIGIGLVYKEMEKRTVYALLTKPVHRWEFIVGKYLGLLFTLLVNVVIMTVGIALTLLYQGGTFSTPALSALFTLFLWIIGHFNADLLQFATLTRSTTVGWIAKSLYYALPNFSNFTTLDSSNIIQSAAHSQAGDAGAILWITVYGLLYCGGLVAVAIMVFSHRDFK
jgi:ABC-type transport system involved in multi-copper enzyme maturation permease subunit